LGTDINEAFDFEGSISEVRVWNEVLDEVSIEEWACTRIDDSHPQYENLIGYWKLNDGLGTSIVNDDSQNNNSGNIIDATWESADSIIINYDYSNTPRLTDLFPTLFTQLCIPVSESWNLDGASLISECQTTSNQDLQNENDRLELHLYPNPSSKEIILELNMLGDHNQLNAEIYNNAGIKLKSFPISSERSTIDISEFSDGIYILKIIDQEKLLLTEKFIIQQ